MKTPRMDTFALPVTPSHIAVTAGLLLTQLTPTLHGEAKGYVTAGLVGLYVLGETIFSSVRAKHVELPDEILKLKAQVMDLEGK